MELFREINKLYKLVIYIYLILRSEYEISRSIFGVRVF